MTTMHPAQVRANRLQNDNDFFAYVKKLGSQAADAAGLEYFKNKVAFWSSKVRQLATMKVPASLEAERRSLLSKALNIRATIEKIMGNIPTLDNIGLGVFPLIVGAAVIAAAVSSMVYWITDYNKFLTKLDAAQKVQAGNNLTPQQAADYVSNIDSGGGGGILGGGIFSGVKKYAIPILIVGGIALFFMSKKNESEE